MEFYLKTKEEYDAIVQNCEAFYRADRFVEGCNVAIYDYRLASLSDFVDNEAFEMRGLCFVEQPDGTWQRNILMNKFFNVGQTEGWMYDDVKDKQVVEVANKEDGSIISFVKFPNGNIRAKSKTSFESDQAKVAQRIYENDENLQKMIENYLVFGFVPIFEIVGPDNQIVLEYQNTELILLQVRDWLTGMYKDVPTAGEGYGVKYAKNFNILYSKDVSILDTLLEMKETDQSNIEGWIVTFSDGQMAKIKTNKYIELHGLIGPDAFRENLLIQTILNGNIDDVIAQLVPGEKKDRIIAMEQTVVYKFNHLVQEYIKLRGLYFNKFQENRKEFAIKHSRDPMFGAIMKSLNTSFRDVEQTAEKAVKEHISKQTNSLGKAKEWIERC